MTAVVSTGVRVPPLLRSAGSVTASAASLAGTPWALWSLVGWPPPDSWPSLDEVRLAVSRSAFDERVLIGLLALLGWFLWAGFAASFLVELAAWWRGRPAAQLPGFGALQGLARNLVATATMLLATPVSAGAGTVRLDAPAAIVQVEPVSPFVLSASGPAPGNPLPSGGLSAPGPTYVVQHRDSLWAIAECQLGDPLRWPEIWELNRERVFDGVRFTDADLIRPGWDLFLPGATGMPTAPVDTPPLDPDPAMIDRGQEASPAPATTSPVGADRTEGAGEPGAATVPGGPAVASPHADPVDSETPGVPWMPYAFGSLLAAAAVAALSRLRRVQSRRRPTGQPPHRPEPSTMRTETAVRRAAAPDRLDRLMAAARAFTAGLPAEHAVPALCAVRVGDDEIELLLGAPLATIPPGFVDRGGMRCFATEPGASTVSLSGIGQDAAAPWPALVEVGTIGDAEVLIDLERAGSLAVTGEAAPGAVRHIATELALSPHSELVELLVVGDELDLAASPRIRSCATVDEALDLLEAQMDATRTALDAARVPDCPTARRDAGNAPWGATVLVLLCDLDEQERARLADGIAPGRGAALVFAGESLPGGWSMHVGETVRLEPHGFELGPLTLDLETHDQIDDLLCDASIGDLTDADEGALEPASEAAEDEATATEPHPSQELPPVHVTTSGVDAAALQSEEAAPEIEVRILGPLEIDGSKPFDRRRSAELVAFLALHPGGVTSGQLRTAIWPEADPSQATFNVTVHRARSTLGLDSEGNHHLPHVVSTDGRYLLGPRATTDLARFVGLVERATRAGSDDARTLLADAMRMIRGQILEGARGFEWAFASGIVTEAEATVSDAAHRLAQLALADGDGELATWAAMQGLKAVPGSEPLYRDRMEAAHLAGDPSAVDRIVEELCRYLETLDPFEDLHPATVELWNRLGRPPC